MFISDAAGFFVKHVDTGMCIYDTSIIQSESPLWGNASFVELSDKCMDTAAQFRFRDNGAMLNLARQGCLSPHYKHLCNIDNDYILYIFYIYVDVFSLDRSACAQRPDQGIYRAINQTSGGGLSVYFRGYNSSLKDYDPFDTWCAVNKRDEKLNKFYGIGSFVGLTKTCDDAPDKRFNFGKMCECKLCFTNMQCAKIF